MPVVAGVGVWTYQAIAAAIHARLESSLGTLLASDVSALGMWLDASSISEVMTADPRVREDVPPLLALSRRTGGDPAALKAAPAQAALREILIPVVSRQDNAGYFVFDPGRPVPGAHRGRADRRRAVLSVADAVAQALAGKGRFPPPR